MTLRIDRKKWILYRHTRSFHLLCTVAELLKTYSKTAISKRERTRLNLKLREIGLYSERNSELPLDAINHRINQISYYMFGYQAEIDGEDRFLFCPLGNLILKHISDNEKSSKIFLTMLWAMQFPHPHSGTDREFQLFPFRLIFRLLMEDRLQNKLYSFEVAYLIVFIKEINPDIYETLVQSLIDLRTRSDGELMIMFSKDEHTFVNSSYEWDYYVSNLLVDAGILDKRNGSVIGRLQHGKTETFRKITRNEVSITSPLINLAIRLEREYSFLDKPLLLNDPERLEIDVVKEIYSFYPRVLLEEIGEAIDSRKLELLNLPKLIEQYSNNTEGEEAYLFEDILVDGFNLFSNVDARKIGGAGKTDIECLYLSRKKKFAVDAKSTKNKLSGISSGRLAGHRDRIGAEYTIVVTPRYVPAVLQDIKSTPIVIIRASTFSEYLYNHIERDIRDIDYEDFDKIITTKFGEDISREISFLTIMKFGTKN